MMAHDVLAAKLQLSVDDVRIPLLDFNAEVRSIRLLSGGLLNSNFRVDLAIGPALLRVYPEGRNIEEIRFEIEVLERLAGSTCKAPVPLAGGKIGSVRGRPFVLLSFLPGRTLQEEDIDERLCVDAGALLGRLHSALNGLSPKSTKPRHDIGYIADLIEETAASVALDNARKLEQLSKIVWDHVGGRDEWGPADGIVHGDYYVENLIRDPSGDLAVVDFDDAYYGTIAFDVAIGAMEFAAKSDQRIDPIRSARFVQAYTRAAGRSPLAPDEMRRAMLINCLRFLCYTLPLTFDAGERFDDNPYAIRIGRLLEPDDQ